MFSGAFSTSSARRLEKTEERLALLGGSIASSSALGAYAPAVFGEIRQFLHELELPLHHHGETSVTDSVAQPHALTADLRIAPRTDYFHVGVRRLSLRPNLRARLFQVVRRINILVRSFGQIRNLLVTTEASAAETVQEIWSCLLTRRCCAATKSERATSRRAASRSVLDGLPVFGVEDDPTGGLSERCDEPTSLASKVNCARALAKTACKPARAVSAARAAIPRSDRLPAAFDRTTSARVSCGGGGSRAATRRRR